MPFAANCSLLFTEFPLLERPAVARAAGFEEIEFWWPFPGPVPASADTDAFVAAIETAGVTLTALTAQLMGALNARGDDGLDHGASLRIIDDLSGRSCPGIIRTETST